MNKYYRAILVLMLSSICMLTMSSLALAEEVQVKELMPLRYSLINTISADLSITNNVAYCSGYVTTKEPCYIELTVELQQYVSGRWITLDSWTATKSNATSLGKSGSSSVGSGRFRTHVTATATNASGSSETASVNSLTKTN